MDQQRRRELFELCDAVREQTVTDAQWGRLQELVADPESREFYVEYMMMGSHLSHVLDGYHAESNENLAVPGQKMLDTLFQQSVSGDGNCVVQPSGRRWSTLIVYAVAMSLVLVAFWWGGFNSRAREPNAFATVTSLTHCKWGTSTLPTHRGARLAEGELELLEGLAKIELDNGVKLSLEGPVSLRLESLTLCEVSSGLLLAAVPGAEIGFRVITPTSEVLDLGTEFSVRVEDGGRTGVRVLSGEVDVTNRSSGESHRLVETQMISVNASNIDRSDDAMEVSIPSQETRPEPAEGIKTRLITTAQGRGRDAFVWRELSSGYESDEMLLLKHCVSHRSEWDRKVYVSFDVESAKELEIDSAELRFTLVPSELGYVTRQKDAVCRVYGIVDESLDDWDEQSINWQNAPANASAADAVDPNLTIPLGSFVIPQGIQTGSVGLKSKSIREFIESDTNGVITLIVVRETRENHWDGGGLVHAFASKEHPSAFPPAIRLVGRQSNSQAN
ncbi:DNRLRE domain-containing protein [Aporhodopirellula aestuarii]|uniref:DNRLRE domain-containing protein n=1 Tax=Aporhodopirellula aestuarii TaxID=2950107 RepID=A0ABT0TZB8_9BACT|nr:DNRLRE domain-containing protein [Aporhodopirellula aestuarii]MCM2369836.1 DNRLRE domain-containing protein [Aporhodopirellula aestuarii]